MIQHIVLWTFKENLDKEAEFARLQQGFAEFTGEVPGMVSLALHRGFQGYDVCLISLHQSRQALEEYQHFPAHLAMKKKVAATRQNRASCDFEVG